MGKINMSGIHAVANHDFDIVFTIIKDFEKKIKINDLQANVILITDKDFLVRNLQEIQKTLIKKTYFVFGSQMYLKYFNIPFIDLDKKLTSSILKRFLSNSKTLTIEYKPRDEAKSLLKKTKVSVIQNLLTTLYKVQNKELRENYKNTIFSYLSNKKDDIKNLENSLILLSKKKSSNLKELIEIINMSIFRETHLTALGEIDNKKISKFDINYILSFKNKVGKV